MIANSSSVSHPASLRVTQLNARDVSAVARDRSQSFKPSFRPERATEATGNGTRGLLIKHKDQQGLEALCVSNGSEGQCSNLPGQMQISNKRILFLYQ